MAFKSLSKSLGIRAKFTLMLALLGAVALVGIGYGAYTFSKQNSMKEADTKARMMEAYVKAGRAYFMKDQRPLINALVERDRFYPELQSGFGITRRILDLVNVESLHGFKFKQASLVPHHPPNKANLFEESIIQRFKAEKKRELFGEVWLNKKGAAVPTGQGEPFYYRSRPIKMAGESCLSCHRDPATAPKDLIELYGTGGFDKNFKSGDIFAAYMVYVPLAPAYAAARLQAAILFGGGASIMLLGLLSIYLFLDIRIVKPIMELSSRTQEVSVGRNLDKSLLSSKMKDEVETLARSIDRLRISLVKMLKRRKND
jgi:HAMP domain-containing protein